MRRNSYFKMYCKIHKRLLTKSQNNFLLTFFILWYIFLVMSNNIDCHVHSFYSPDGSESPNMLFKRALKNNLKGLVVADHNTMAHFVSIKRAAKKFKLLTCEGVEITASYKGADIHILGYSKSFNKKSLEPLLKGICVGYNKRSKTTLSKLKKIGINISFLELLKKTKSGYVTKPVIARQIALIKNISQKEALSFVERGGVAYVPYGPWAPTPSQVVRAIREAGGRAVFAHPGDFFKKRNSLPIYKREKLFKKLLHKLIKVGLSGIEVQYPTHTQKEIIRFTSIARKYNLISTGGSDYHGMVFTPHRLVGQCGATQYIFSKLS